MVNLKEPLEKRKKEIKSLQRKEISPRMRRSQERKRPKEKEEKAEKAKNDVFMNTFMKYLNNYNSIII